MVSGALFSFIGGAGYVLAPFGGLPPGTTSVSNHAHYWPFGGPSCGNVLAGFTGDGGIR